MLYSLRKIYKTLLIEYGFQHWWPAETPLRVIIGAILAQNSKWSSVEKVMEKFENFSDEDILKIGREELSKIIYSTPFSKKKANFLKNIFQFYNKIEEYTSASRDEILKISGVGPETADSIMLYAFNGKTVPIDFYTERFISRYLGFKFDEKYYEFLRSEFLKSFDKMELMEFHALIVEHSKKICKKNPNCSNCPLISCKSKYRSASD